jgi:hypothetical protein
VCVPCERSCYLKRPTYLADSAFRTPKTRNGSVFVWIDWQSSGGIGYGHADMMGEYGKMVMAVVMNNGGHHDQHIASRSIYGDKEGSICQEHPPSPACLLPRSTPKQQKPTGTVVSRQTFHVITDLPGCLYSRRPSQTLRASEVYNPTKNTIRNPPLPPAPFSFSPPWARAKWDSLMTASHFRQIGSVADVLRERQPHD